jgi:2-polyprenyl-3-methyl-5-hydroxy-6-metoxy-1,4-benzoquinol methylase
MTNQEIRAELSRLSGSGKRVVSTRVHGLYSTITLPEFKDMSAVRDTEKRFNDFVIPPSLEGKTFLDIGSNVGAMAFEAAQRGAKVTGVEFREDRVSLCNVIAQHHDLKAKFYQHDFNLDTTDDREWYRPHDIVLCCSVDEYIDDRETFYDMLHELTRETLYFECNVQRDQDVETTMFILERAGFEKIGYLGSGHSGGISRKRKIYRATP